MTRFNTLLLAISFLVYCKQITTTTVAPLNATFNDDRARIIGGVPVQLGELKYQLSLRYLGLHHCGASLVEVSDLQIALTAAHCVRNLVPNDLSLVAGDVRLSERSGTEQERQVSKIVSHERFSYNLSAFSYDISILFFEPFVLNEFVGPIPLPPAFAETKSKLIGSGWGVYNSDGFISDNLTKLEIPFVDLQTCRYAYAGVVKEFYNHYICAGFNNSRKDSCRGDSGGPLRSMEEGYLAGIISWGVGCGNVKYPGVNTKVSYFTDWIADQVKTHKGDDSKEDSDEDTDGNKRQLVAARKTRHRSLFS